MIFGGPHIVGSSRIKARTGPTIVVTRMEDRPNKDVRRESEDITFIEREAH